MQRNVNAAVGFSESTRELMMLSIPSQSENISKVEIFVDQIQKRFGLCSESFGNVLISLTEAVNNAIIHGNCNDPSKMVHVKACKECDFIKISIQDQGKGFDPACVPDPTTPENLLTLGGRGVFLMKQLCDKIKFKENGTCVEMSFKV